MSEQITNILQLVFYFAVLVIVLVLSLYALRLIRANLLKPEPKPVDYLESFRKMHDEGKLSAEEFRMIRKLLSLQLTRNPNEFLSESDVLNAARLPAAKKIGKTF